MAGGNPGPPQGQQMLIVAEPSLQLPSFSFGLFCVVLDYNSKHPFSHYFILSVSGMNIDGLVIKIYLL